MREPLLRGACLAVGLTGVVVPVAQAKTFRPMVIPATGLGSTIRPGAPAVAGNVLILLPGSVSALPEPARTRPEQSYLEPHGAAILANDPLDSIRRNLRVRGSGIFDVYARRSSGFRISAGSHYNVHYAAPEYGPGAISSSSAMMRLPGGAVALRDGYEWYAPVAMAGYDMLVAKRLKVGVEGGMMLGRANAIFGTSDAPGEHISRSTRNPVADVVMTYQF